MRLRNTFRSLAVSGLILSLAACSDSPVQPTAVADPALASRGLTLFGTVTVTPGRETIEVGATIELSANVSDRRRVPVANAKVIWLSDNSSVATVSQAGVVTGLKPGVANITGVSSFIWDTSPITVVEAVTPPTTPKPDTVVTPPPTTPKPDTVVTTPKPDTAVTPTPTTPKPDTTIKVDTIKAPTPPTPPAPPVTPATPNTPTTGSDWTFCTNEGSMCRFLGMREVRLAGSTGGFVSQFGYRAVPCAAYGFSNQNPAPGKALHCDYGPVQTMTLNNPFPGMSGLSPSTVTVPRGSPGVSGAQMQSSGGSPSYTDGSGSFRLICSLAKYDFIDPIVFPGQPDKSHLHVFFGNTGVNANSTPESIAGSGNSTCLGGTLNRTAYWMPAMFDARNGQIQLPDEGVFYYKTGYGMNPKVIKPFPAGLRMIAGSAKSTGVQNYLEWGCRDKYTSNTGSIPTSCPVGDAVRVSIIFPQCWDGKNLDSPDHKSHMAYPNYKNPPQVSTCPPSHPIAIPAITEHFDYPVTATSHPSTWRLASDMYSTSMPGGLSVHADWMNGWDPSTISTIVTQCLNKALDCQVGLLGNGKTLY